MSDHLVISLLFIAFSISFFFLIFSVVEQTKPYIFVWFFLYPAFCLISVWLFFQDIYSSANGFDMVSPTPSEEIVYRSVLFLVSFLILFNLSHSVYDFFYMLVSRYVDKKWEKRLSEIK